MDKSYTDLSETSAPSKTRTQSLSSSTGTSSPMFFNQQQSALQLKLDPASFLLLAELIKQLQTRNAIDLAQMQKQEELEMAEKQAEEEAQQHFEKHIKSSMYV